MCDPNSIKVTIYQRDTLLRETGNVPIAYIACRTHRSQPLRAFSAGSSNQKFLCIIFILNQSIGDMDSPYETFQSSIESFYLTILRGKNLM